MRGFTLIELTLYLMIVAIMLVLLGVSLWNIILGDIKESSWLEVQQNARFALTKIRQEIKKAARINDPIPGQSASTLSLAMATPSLNPTVIDLDDGKIRIRRGNSGHQEITSDLTIVGSLQFTNLSYSDTPGAIRTEMNISHVNPQNRAEYEATISVKSTTSLFPGGAVYNCQGIPTPCEQFFEQNPCQNQEGCSWTQEAYCGGSCTRCRDLSQVQCDQQSGCSWLLVFCRGRCTPCDDFLNQDSCQNQLGCSWNPIGCSGSSNPCESYTREEDCLNQVGCQWEVL